MRFVFLPCWCHYLYCWIVSSCGLAPALELSCVLIYFLFLFSVASHVAWHFEWCVVCIYFFITQDDGDALYVLLCHFIRENKKRNYYDNNVLNAKDFKRFILSFFSCCTGHCRGSITSSYSQGLPRCRNWWPTHRYIAINSTLLGVLMEIFGHLLLALFLHVSLVITIITLLA